MDSSSLKSMAVGRYSLEERFMAKQRKIKPTRMWASGPYTYRSGGKAYQLRDSGGLPHDIEVIVIKYSDYLALRKAAKRNTGIKPSKAHWCTSCRGFRSICCYRCGSSVSQKNRPRKGRQR